MAFKMQGMSFHDQTRDEELPALSGLKQTEKPDWSKAPKPGTQERTLWYQKHKLVLDETTPKLEESPFYVDKFQEGTRAKDSE